MIEVIISALVLASLYGLVAIGISFTWASIGMLNLAQGFIFTAGGYAAYLFASAATNAHLSGALLSAGVLVFGMAASAPNCGSFSSDHRINHSPPFLATDGLPSAPPAFPTDSWELSLSRFWCWAQSLSGCGQAELACKCGR